MERLTPQAVAYYPGCSAHGTGVEYDLSTRQVCDALSIELREINDWNCCGATSAHAIDGDLSLALGARNLALAENEGLKHLLVPCAACFNRLRHAAVHIEKEGTPLGLTDVRGSVEVTHLLDMFCADDVLEKLKSRKFSELHRLSVVPYYGCLIVRPLEVTGAKDAENPMMMDRILQKMEVDVASWPYKTKCCGTSLSMTRTDIVERMTDELIEMARLAGAEAIVTACPLCFVNLDTRQRAGSQRLPVFYITELMAVYMDLDGARANLGRHQISPLPLLKSKGIY